MAMEETAFAAGSNNSTFHDGDLLSGFTDDVQTLLCHVIKRFDASSSLRYEHFAQVWQEMSFSLIFCGRKFFRELWEFTEAAFRHVKEVMHKTKKFSVRAACLYLLYGLYFKQPISPRVKIVLTSADFAMLESFVSNCRTDEHWDLSYVYIKMINSYAFLFGAIDQPVGLEVMMKYDNRVQLNSAQLGRVSRSSRLNLDAMEMNLEEISRVHDRYCDMKKHLSQPHSEGASNRSRFDPAMSLIRAKYPDKLVKSLRMLYALRGEKYKGVLQETAVEEEVTSVEPKFGELSSIGERRARLREKAFARSAQAEKNKKLIGSILQDDDELDISGASDGDEEYVPPTNDQPKRKRRRKGSSLSSGSPEKHVVSKRRRRVGASLKSINRDGRDDEDCSVKHVNSEVAGIVLSLAAARQDPQLLEGLNFSPPSSPDAEKSDNEDPDPLNELKKEKRIHRQELRQKLKETKKKMAMSPTSNQNELIVKSKTTPKKKSVTKHSEKSKAKIKKASNMKVQKSGKTKKSLGAAADSEANRVGSELKTQPEGKEPSKKKPKSSARKKVSKNSNLVKDDNPLSGIMEIVEEYPPPASNE